MVIVCRSEIAQRRTVKFKNASRLLDAMLEPRENMLARSAGAPAVPSSEKGMSVGTYELVW